MNETETSVPMNEDSNIIRHVVPPPVPKVLAQMGPMGRYKSGAPMLQEIGILDPVPKWRKKPEILGQMIDNEIWTGEGEFQEWVAPALREIMSVGHIRHDWGTLARIVCRLAALRAFFRALAE